MCKGKDCKLKYTCYRHIAPESFRQSYFVESPNEKIDSCDHYWDYVVSNEPKKKRLGRNSLKIKDEINF